MNSKEFLSKIINSNQEDYKKKHKELNDLARKAQDAYYNSGETIMSDKEYDNLYDKIQEIEDKYNYHPEWSVINSAGIEIKVPKGEAVTHEFPCLSQAKTKNRNDLVKFVKDKDAILSWKCDGSTVVLTYENQKLIQVATRGNGTVGQNITEFGKTQNCFPKTIQDKGHVVVRGEYLMTYTEFNRINNSGGEVYKNPRNLASGNTNQRNMTIAKQRQGEFYVFELAKCFDYDKLKTYEDQLLWCKNQGFNIVGYKKVNANNLLNEVNWFENEINKLNYPTDGLVLRFNDIAYGDSLGYTEHNPRFALAFKWKDDTEETVLRNISWQASRTGRINPIANFDPVELEGTTVRNATLNNLTFIKKMKLGIGDTIEVYKANKIIPAILCSHEQSNNIQFPTTCPSCGSPLKIKNDGIAEFLICENVNCPAKNIKALELFAGKSGLDIQGISEKTIESISELGILNNYLDFFKLPNHKQELQTLDNFGERAYTNLCNSLEKCKDCEPHKVLVALGINNIGTRTAKDIVKILDGDISKLIEIDQYNIPLRNIGNVAFNSLYKYFKDINNQDNFGKLLNILRVKQPVSISNNTLGNSVFVITGSLINYPNREALVKDIEANGGIVGSGVNKDTSYLINNDINSTSSKNIKAKQLGIPIITEQEFINMIKDNSNSSKSIIDEIRTPQTQKEFSKKDEEYLAAEEAAMNAGDYF